MTSGIEQILPQTHEISDEAAAVLTEVLFQLAGVCDSRYFAKIQRHQRSHPQGVDPERPWNRTPTT